MVTLFGSSAWAASMAVRARSRGVDIVVVMVQGGFGNRKFVKLCCDACARVR